MRFVKRFLSTFLGKLIVFLLVLITLRTISSTKQLKPILKGSTSEPLAEKQPVSTPTPIVEEKKTVIDKPADIKPEPPKVEMKPVEKSPEIVDSKPKVVEAGSRLVLSDKESALLNNFDTKDFKKMGETLRLFKKVHDFVWSRPSSRVVTTQKEAVKILEKLESMMFSWIKPGFQSTVELRASFKGKGRGIVLCAGNGHMITALPTLRMIREIHGFDIPFEIFYTGDGDLSPENRKKFESIGNTVAKDITKIFNNEILKLGGWAVKSFALLASSFAESMLIE